MSSLFRLSVCVMALALAGCQNNILSQIPVYGNAPEASDTQSAYPTMNTGAISTPTIKPTPQKIIRVSMLLPLTGKNAALGAAMQNAGTLAMTDLGDQTVEMTFEDTGSTPAGAQTAAERALNAGAQLLIGPIFADEARAAIPVAQRHQINLITFSTDTSLAGGHTYVAGILPQDQARQIARFAGTKTLKHILVIAANDTYGDLSTRAFVDEARRYNIQTTLMKHPVKPDVLAPLFAPAGTRNQVPIDGVFIPLSADLASQNVHILKTFATATPLTYLGMGLWDDADTTRMAELNGAYYAAPAPSARMTFEQNYARNFGTTPPRLASLGYDVTALAVVLARLNNANSYDTQSLMTPSGFSGIDGLFRFGADGLAERGLAVMQLQTNGRSIAAPAAGNFDTP